VAMHLYLIISTNDYPTLKLLWCH